MAKFVLLSFRTFYSLKKMFLQLVFANFITAFSCYGSNCKITFQPLFKQQFMILSQFKCWSCQIIGNHSLPDNCNASHWFRKPVCRTRQWKAHRGNSHAFTFNKQWPLTLILSRDNNLIHTNNWAAVLKDFLS